jgi:small subunit ribosomal protein S18
MSILKTKQCPFCANNQKTVDYKDIETLKAYLDSHGRINHNKRSAVCSRHQRSLSTAIKRARSLALLPFLVS